jgi:hypothetical protein
VTVAPKVSGICRDTRAMRPDIDGDVVAGRLGSGWWVLAVGCWVLGVGDEW